MSQNDSAAEPVSIFGGMESLNVLNRFKIICSVGITVCKATGDGSGMIELTTPSGVYLNNQLYL